jgi:lipopolysaccharide export system permease protein
MNIISRYILKAHIAPFFFGAFTVLFLFMFQFILKYIDQLVGKGLDTWIIIQLIGLNLAWMVVLAVPMGVLFSTLMTFGGLATNHEVTIIKASGTNLIAMMRPIILMGILLSFGLFWFNDYVLPEANHKAKTLMSDIRRTKPTFSIVPGQFGGEIDGYTILSRRVDSLSGKMLGVTIYDNTKGALVNVVSADTGVVEFSYDMSKIIMNLYNGEIHQLGKGRLDNYKKIKFGKYRIAMKISGFEFSRSSEGDIHRGDRELHIADMEEFIGGYHEKRAKSELKLRKIVREHMDYLQGKQRDSVKLTDTEEKIKRDRKKISSINSDGQIIEGFPNRSDNDINRRSDRRRNDLAVNTDSLSEVDKEIQTLQRVEKRINFLRSNMSMDVTRIKDYDIQIKQYEVEIHKKYAIPFACLIFLFVGCPLGIISRGGNFGISAAFTLGFYIFYWACLIGGEKLADRGIISPFLSMWAGNIIVGVLGIILTIRVNTESWRINPLDLFRKN